MPFSDETVSNTAESKKVQDAILAEAERFGYTDPDLFAIRLAVEEALVNAIKHGNRSDPGKKVKVSYEVTDEKVCVRIEDEGPGFDRTKIPDPTSHEHIEKPGGRGLLLMEHYMSEVTRNARGNYVELVRRRGHVPRTEGETAKTGTDTVVGIETSDT